MKIPFSKILSGKSKSIPEIVINELNSHFPDAINIDWEKKEAGYEAVFYLQDVEHIAHISPEGILKTYKRNLWPNELPGSIAEVCKQHGEIMNAIAIFHDQEQFFEIIVRDKNFNRTLLLFQKNAVLVEKRKI